MQATRTIFFLAALGMLAAPVFAQPGGGPGRGGAMMWKAIDADGNGKLSLAEWTAHFKAMDANKDGQVDATEIRAHHRRGGMGMGPGANRTPRIIVLLDTNKDQKISAAEWESHFRDLDSDKNGQVDASEFAKHRGGMPGRKQ